MTYDEVLPPDGHLTANSTRCCSRVLPIEIKLRGASRGLSTGPGRCLIHIKDTPPLTSIRNQELVRPCVFRRGLAAPKPETIRVDCPRDAVCIRASATLAGNHNGTQQTAREAGERADVGKPSVALEGSPKQAEQMNMPSGIKSRVRNGLSAAHSAQTPGSATT